MKNSCIAFFLIIIVLLAVNPVYGQGSNFTDAELTQLGTSLNEVRGNYYLKSQTRKVQGDPYYNDEWTQGKVMITDKAETGQLSLRFNMEDNVLEFTRNDQVYVIYPEDIKGFLFYGPTGSTTFKKGFLSEEHNINRSTFLEVLHSGKVSLVARHWASLKEDIPTYGSANINDKYVDNVEYYVVNQSGSIEEIRLRRRDVLKSMEKPHRNAVEEFASSNNLSFKELGDLKLVFDYYNSLLPEKQ